MSAVALTLPPSTNHRLFPKSALILDIAGITLPMGTKEYSLQRLLDEVEPLPESIETIQRAMEHISPEFIFHCSRAEQDYIADYRKAWLQKKVVPKTGILLDDEHLFFVGTRASKAAIHKKIIHETNRRVIMIDNSLEVAEAILEASGFMTQVNGKKTYLQPPDGIFTLYGLHFEGADKIKSMMEPNPGIVLAKSWQEIRIREGWLTL